MNKILIIFLSLFLINSVYSQKKTVKKPKLVIGIVVEGMRYDYLFRYWNLFGEKGFKKLINKGSFYKNASYDYLFTESASAYATISSGSNPSKHGITGEYFYDRLKERDFYCVYDKKYSQIGNDSINSHKSPTNLFVSTIGDELRISNFKQSKVISVALKDYASILSAGHAGNIAFWFDYHSGEWVSSSYYTNKFPFWAKRFNRKNMPEIYSLKTWNTGKNINHYNNSLLDDSKYEKGFAGQHTFPYEMATVKNTFKDYDFINHTPYGNTFVKDFAVSAIINEDLGKDSFSDILTISFSANANIAKRFGIRSIELADSYLQLDKDIENLLNFVEDYIGKENVLIYLTSDRGDTDNSDFLNDMHMPSGYFNDKNSESLLRSYIRAIYKNGRFISDYKNGQIYLNHREIEKAGFTLSEVQKTIANFMIDFKAVSNVVSSTDIETGNFTQGIYMKAKNSYNQKRSGDLFINLSTGIKNRSNPYMGNGYNDYTHVPLIFYGWKIQKNTSNTKISITDIAPTISDILEISAPNSSSGKVIEDLVKNK